MPNDLRSHPQPVRGYDEALRRIEALQAKDGDGVNPVCRTKFMTHGRKVERVLVALHGLTNCPQGWERLGRMFFERGYNVFIPRAPHHGLKDRLTTDLTQLTAEDLTALTDEAADIGHGLGDHVTLAGISMAGNMTAWAAQHRPDIDLAVVMAPSFGAHLLPGPAFAWLLTRLLRSLKRTLIWWDPVQQQARPAPPYAYQRYAARALGEVFWLGEQIRAEARQSKPAARAVLVVTNANDDAVDNRMAYRVVADWRRHGAANVETYEFPLAIRAPHDLLSPENELQKIDVVYPILLDLIHEGTRRDTQFVGGG